MYYTDLLPQEIKQSNKAICVAEVRNSFFFMTMLSDFQSQDNAIPVTCLVVLQSSVPTLVLLSLSFYCLFTLHYNIFSIQLTIFKCP